MLSEEFDISRKARHTEGKVQGLGREVTDHVGGVTSPEGKETLITVGTAEAVDDTLVGCGQATLLDLKKGSVNV